MPTKVDEMTLTSCLIDNIYINIPESDADMSGVLKTHIGDRYSIFHVHKNSDGIIHKQYRVKRNTSETFKLCLTLLLRESNHNSSGVLAMGRETAVCGSPIYPGLF